MRYWIIVTLNNNNRGRPPDRGRVDGYVDRSACPFTIPSRLLVLSCQTSLDLPGFAQLNTCQKFHSDDDYTLYSSLGYYLSVFCFIRALPSPSCRLDIQTKPVN